jgi:cytochrome P450
MVKKAPLFESILVLARQDGLASEDEVAKQITFVTGMNSFLGIQNLLKSIVGELSLDAAHCAALREEMTSELGSNPGEVTCEDLEKLPMLDKTLREVLRLHPPVFFVTGRTTQDRSIASASGSFKIRKGELLMGVIPLAHRDASIFARPDQFDPHRFDDEVASHHLIWPRGLHEGRSTFKSDSKFSYSERERLGWDSLASSI